MTSECLSSPPPPPQKKMLFITIPVSLRELGFVASGTLATNFWKTCTHDIAWLVAIYFNISIIYMRITYFFEMQISCFNLSDMNVGKFIANKRK